MLVFIADETGALGSTILCLQNHEDIAGINCDVAAVNIACYHLVMALSEFEKEEALQRLLIENQIDACDIDDRGECQAVATAAARIAHERFLREHFGSFSGADEGIGIVFANMGPSNQPTREHFRRRLMKAGAEELAMAAWPQDGPGAHYTWAVFYLDDAARDWEAVARHAWMAETED